ncbi:MAG: biotin--[acetyl-CoA-carboxylase] ligase [Pseudomonadota bacterium]
MNAPAPDDVITLPTGTQLYHYKTIGSTNAEAFALHARGIALPAWVYAENQSDGRGRGQNVWQSLPGNLQASYIFPTDCEMQHLSQLAFVAGLAVRDTVSATLSVRNDQNARISLKWPNDVLCNGEKIAGILVQTMRPDINAPSIAVIGIGLNIASSPQGLDQRVTSLRQLFGPSADLLSPLAAIGDLDRNLSGWLVRWKKGDGWSDVRTNWIAENDFIGHRVSVKQGSSTLSGVMKGLDATGALLIETDDHVQRHVTFGDIALD